MSGTFSISLPSPLQRSIDGNPTVTPPIPTPQEADSNLHLNILT